MTESIAEFVDALVDALAEMLDVPAAVVLSMTAPELRLVASAWAEARRVDRATLVWLGEGLVEVRDAMAEDLRAAYEFRDRLGEAP